MESIVMEQTVDGVLEAVFDAANDGVFVVAPDPETIEGLVRVLDEGSPSIRLLADTAALKSVTGDFSVAGRAANHTESGLLEIRRYDDGTNTMVVTGSSVVAIVRAQERTAGLETDDDAFVEDAGRRLRGVWADADSYDIRTPSLIRVRETLEAELGRATAEDFEAIRSAVQTDRTDDSLDEVAISLLAAARNGDLLYDISKWGEDVGIASKATFSRTKTRLEERGIIETEKVPIDVGRPRLRLRLGSDRLAADDEDELVRTVRSMLAA